MSSDIESRVGQVLRVLVAARQRATYTAVGEYIGLPARSVGRLLGMPRPQASFVVASSTGQPTGYEPDQKHPCLTENPRVIRSGDDLALLMTEARASSIATDASGVVGRIVGVDLAWSTEKNGSGLAFGDLDRDGLTVSEVIGGVVGLDQVQSLILESGPIRGVAIDAPLIIENETGSRPCERALSDVYGSRWAGCHASNQARYPDASSVRLSTWLASNGFRHLDQENRWQIEVYPHPALIEIFGLEKRLAYKKGSTAQRRTGQTRLVELLLSLSTDKSLPMKICMTLANRFSSDYVNALPPGRLKENEDMLDAVVCCYIGARFALGITDQVFGDTSSGYIVVP